MAKGRELVMRIPVSQKAWRRLKDFTLGADCTFDEAVEVLMDCVKGDSENDVFAGFRHREQIEQFRNKGD